MERTWKCKVWQDDRICSHVVLDQPVQHGFSAAVIYSNVEIFIWIVSKLLGRIKLRQISLVSSENVASFENCMSGLTLLPVDGNSRGFHQIFGVNLSQWPAISTTLQLLSMAELSPDMFSVNYQPPFNLSEQEGHFCVRWPILLVITLLWIWCLQFLVLKQNSSFWELSWALELVGYYFHMIQRPNSQENPLKSLQCPILPESDDGNHDVCYRSPEVCCSKGLPLTAGI